MSADQVPQGGQSSPANYVGDFSSLSARAQAYINTLAARAGQPIVVTVDWPMDLSGFDGIALIPKRTGFDFMLSDLWIECFADISAEISGKILRLTDSGPPLNFQTFAWNDISSVTDLVVAGRVARLGLAGMGGAVVQGDLSISNDAPCTLNTMVRIFVIGFFIAEF